MGVVCPEIHFLVVAFGITKRDLKQMDGGAKDNIGGERMGLAAEPNVSDTRERL